MESKGKQEGERVQVLGFSQAGMLSQARVHREFSSLERGEHPCCLENKIDLSNNVRVDIRANLYLKALRYTIWQKSHLI